MSELGPHDSPHRVLSQLEPVFGISLSGALRRSTLDYVRLLIKWNQRINLIGRAALDDILRFHFFESYWVAEHFVSDSSRLVDVGTGAGFPGLAIKLYRPSVDLILIERSQKKCVFLAEACRLLRVSAEIKAQSMEDFRDWEGRDLVTIRALRPSARLIQCVLQHNLALLLLHGKGCSLQTSRLSSVKRLRVPATEGRYATLFRKTGG